MRVDELGVVVALAEAQSTAAPAEAPPPPDQLEAPRPRNAPRATYLPPTLALADLDERHERDLLRAHPEGVLASVGPFVPGRNVVVLVHGMSDSPEAMQALAQRFCERQVNVMVFAYDDTGRTIAESSTTLARELGCLRPAGAGSQLTIVGHSLGGIVGRAALATLAQPQWHEAQAPVGSSRAGFSDARLIGIDAPWDGYAPKVPFRIPVLSVLLDLLLRAYLYLSGAKPLAELDPDSQLLHDLSGAETHSREYRIEARQPGIFSDGIRSLDELDDAGKRQLVDALQNDTEPHDSRVRLLAASLRHDARYPELRRMLARDPEAAAGDFDAVLRVIDRVMPPIDASHRGMLSEQALLDQVVALSG